MTPRRSFVRFAIIFSALLGGFYVLYVPVSQTDTYRSYYLAPLAEVSGAALRIAGFEVEVTDRLIRKASLRFKIVPGCDGAEAIALLAAAVMASPVSLRSRLWFTLIGTLGLLVINLGRIVILFAIGVHYPRLLEQMHYDLWPGIIIVLVFSSWVVWARLVWSKEEKAGDVTT